MASNTKEIKRRIKSISNTLQVTKALEMISSVKMRKAVAIADGSREFSNEVWELITSLYPSGDENNNLPKLYKKNSAKKKLVLIIASDKGLAGSYNANIIKKAREVILADDIETDVITVGKKAKKVERIRENVNIVSHYDQSDEDYDFFQANPISKMIIDKFLEGEYSEVIAVYTDFVNTLKQTTTSKTILPISIDCHSDSVTAEEESDKAKDRSFANAPSFAKATEGKQDDKTDSTDYRLPTTGYIYEPDTTSILETLGMLATRSQIYQAFLEASASEHAARMVAMKNATENGKTLVEDLRFAYNKLRQGSITAEIAEISAGRIALAG